jgi:UDP-2,4-diacetamido-2,4,6-trideoxy-beta-L-altropyranose hydrolase
MRDLVLAKQYPNADIIFATQNLSGNIDDKIIQDGYSVKTLQTSKIKELDKLVKELKIDLLIIDHYEINHTQERKLKLKNPTLKLMVVDDLYEKHHCDIVLNHNIYAKKREYKGKVPKGCDIKCGAKYTLLRDEFLKEQRRTYKQRDKLTLFIAMGGADTANLNIKILKSLKNFKKIKVNLVTTTANQNLEKLQKYCKKREWIKLHINSNSIAKLMKKSDLAIITPSVTANELYFLKKPFIAIETASNQKLMSRFLKSKNYIVYKV